MTKVTRFIWYEAFNIFIKSNEITRVYKYTTNRYLKIKALLTGYYR